MAGVLSVLDILRTPNGLRMVAAGAAVLTVVAASWGGYKLVSQPSCADQIRLSIVAAPEIEPAVRATTQEWTAAEPRINDRCVAVDVSAAAPADVAAAIAGQHRATLPGVGQAAGGVRVPDVWIPDSSSWLQRLRAAGPGWVPKDAPAVAQSPVVLAMPEPVASSVGWPNEKLTWRNLLSRVREDSRLRPGIVEPNRDASGLSGLLALSTAARSVGGDKGQQVVTAILRSLAVGRSTLRADLLARFPRATDAASLASSLSAAPLSEQAVIGYNRERPPVPLAALYLDDPTPLPMNYPYTVMPGIEADKVAAARAVNVALSGDAYRDRLAALGLRGADGNPGQDFAAPLAAPTAPAPASPLPDPATIDRALSAWTTVTAPGRLLAVLDVSGSMNQPVPTAGGATRSQVTVEAAKRGLGLLDDNWAVGLWIFSTQLVGDRDWRQLVPIGPLSSQRERLLAGLSSIPARLTGGTGLYNTILAAYQEVLNGWDPGRVNGIVIMTDGKNELAPGLTLPQLIARLNAVKDPTRPVQVIALGIGDEVSEAELRQITGTTGGGTFLARDPSKVGEILLQAIGLRPGTAQ
ncbi:MAG TPA: substrate-binding domain-containing protein [Pilimelia sp.]|nr:substrate-binding domain-containing protein [Pilimelia sp.]